jgi:phospholipid/cholesterol/gamma-HCH transport system substrate-binding protein
LSGNFSKISDSLNKADIGKSVRNLNATLAKVDGIMTQFIIRQRFYGQILNDDAFYQNIKSSTKELELLLQDVRLYPKVCQYLYLERKINPM